MTPQNERPGAAAARGHLRHQAQARRFHRRGVVRHPQRRLAMWVPREHRFTAGKGSMDGWDCHNYCLVGGWVEPL